MKVACTVGVIVGLALQVSAQTPVIGRLVLSENYGRAIFSECLFTLYYYQPHSSEVDRVELHCTPLSGLGRNPLSTTRKLSAAESNRVAKLAADADLYAGGHTGDLTRNGSEGPAEQLHVRCCAQPQTDVVLVVTGNPTFMTGPRRELLKLLDEWRTPLRQELLKRLRR